MKVRKTNVFSLAILSGVLAFISGFTVALPMAEISGVAILPGIIMPFLINLFFISTALISRSIGSATFASFLYGFLSIPFPILGPPGFIFKIAIITIPTFFLDIVIWLRPSIYGCLIGGLLGSIPVNVLMIALFALFGIPFDFMLPLLLPIELLVAISGTSGALVAWKIGKVLHDSLNSRMNK